MVFINMNVVIVRKVRLIKVSCCVLCEKCLMLLVIVLVVLVGNKILWISSLSWIIRMFRYGIVFVIVSIIVINGISVISVVNVSVEFVCNMFLF